MKGEITLLFNNEGCWPPHWEVWILFGKCSRVTAVFWRTDRTWANSCFRKTILAILWKMDSIIRKVTITITHLRDNKDLTRAMRQWIKEEDKEDFMTYWMLQVTEEWNATPRLIWNRGQLIAKQNRSFREGDDMFSLVFETPARHLQIPVPDLGKRWDNVWAVSPGTGTKTV